MLVENISFKCDLMVRKVTPNLFFLNFNLHYFLIFLRYQFFNFQPFFEKQKLQPVKIILNQTDIEPHKKCSAVTIGFF